MKATFLYRLKKYGTWNEGKMDLDSNSTNDVKSQIEFYLKEKYPTSNRIEIKSISKK